MNDLIKQTSLYHWHVAQRANMANFGGYKMPLWYSSAKTEHLAVLTSAGIFDTSHMALVHVTGPEAHALLQLCFTNNLDGCVGKAKKKLFPGRCVYGAFLNEKGEVIDDTIIYMLEENNYIAVVNAGMGGRVAKHLHTNKRSMEAMITDLTDHIGKIDVQGPMAAKIIDRALADPAEVFDAMPYFSFKGYFEKSSPLAETVRLVDGTPILLSRTGYTGEFGFEIFINKLYAIKLWETLLEIGKDFGLMPCGLAARDSLRGGAVLPLSHQDIGKWPFIHHPWPFALPLNGNQLNFTKEFIGSESLLNIESPVRTYAFLGNDLRKVSTADSAVALNTNGQEIGQVLTCVTDMGIGRNGEKIYSIASPDKPDGFKPKGLCCGFIKVCAELKSGDVVVIRDKRRKLKVTVVADVRPDRTARYPISEML